MVSKKRKIGDGGPKYYAVRAGHTPGVYTNWEDCQEQITGFKGAQFKAYLDKTEAEMFVTGKSLPVAQKTGDKFYGVAVGRVPGVYETWDEASEQVVGVKGPKYKKFATRKEAEDFVKAGGNKVAAELTPTPKSTSNPLPKESKKSKVKEETSSYFKDEIDESSDSKPPVTKKIKTAPSQPVISHAGMKGDTLVVYTDGSSLGNGKKGAQAGVGVYFGEGDPRNVSEPLAGMPQTNQRAELTAVLRALQICEQVTPILIITDSNYSINCCTLWHTSWERNGWKTSTGGSVLNKDLVVDIRKLIEQRKAKNVATNFRWIKGHSNDKGNEAADRLAVAGARMAMR
ncbi:hypothetical protein BP6252_07923 [Coleophoma cylindrospora]|uniref:Ribonuclease H n=1 Tax=Coleophoma cylindrospora TaxID=1849047 RepID=A0A3D8RBK1_9HELO|nr:hypothetical protein BP6252_07923 [Coleophoma cylindrospora]